MHRATSPERREQLHLVRARHKFHRSTASRLLASTFPTPRVNSTCPRAAFPRSASQCTATCAVTGHKLNCRWISTHTRGAIVPFHRVIFSSSRKRMLLLRLVINFSSGSADVSMSKTSLAMRRGRGGNKKLPQGMKGPSCGPGFSLPAITWKLLFLLRCFFLFLSCHENHLPSIFNSGFIKFHLRHKFPLWPDLFSR